MPEAERDVRRDGSRLVPELLSALPWTSGRATIDLADPVFERISALAFDGAFREAALQAQQRWQARVYDVRVVGYFLYGVFQEHGIAALPTMLRGIVDLLQRHWELLGPVDHRRELADSALHWLFRKLERELEHGERVRDAAWRERTRPVHRPALRRAQELVPAVHQALAHVLASRRSVERFEGVARALVEVERGMDLAEWPIAAEAETEAIDVAPDAPDVAEADDPFAAPDDPNGALEPADDAYDAFVSAAADPEPPPAPTSAPSAAAAPTLTLPVALAGAVMTRGSLPGRRARGGRARAGRTRRRRPARGRAPRRVR
jgi:hypothetical protein